MATTAAAATTFNPLHRPRAPQCTDGQISDNTIVTIADH